jgi:hypothetical protein
MLLVDGLPKIGRADIDDPIGTTRLAELLQRA